MASKVEYTATISVPVYTCWKCQKCNCINSNNGVLMCQGTTTSYSFKESKLENAKDTAATFVEAEWKKNALNIITNPRSFPELFRTSLNLGKVECSNCGKRPIWNKKGSFLTVLMFLAFFIGFVTLYFVISGKATLTTWLILLACAGIIFLIINSDKIYDKKITELPEQYLPVIGTQNEEMLIYAEHYGKKIPTPQECIAIASGTCNKES